MKQRPARESQPHDHWRSTLSVIADRFISDTDYLELSDRLAANPAERLLARWMFGLVQGRVTNTSTKSPSAKKLPWSTNTKKSPANKASHLYTLLEKPLRHRVKKFIKDLWQAIQKRDVDLHIRIGLGDPAETGQLWAIIGPIAGLFASVQTATIRIEPEFFDATFELNSQGTIRIIPLQLIYLTIGLLLSPPVWRGIIKMRSTAS